MGSETKIEWCDHTFNPWEGCQKVSPGCDHCYAEARNARFGGGTAVNWGPGAPRRRTSDANWLKPRKWNAAHVEFFAVHGRRQRVFCSSLADVFDNAVNPKWRQDLFELIRATPMLDWLLLTKRIGSAARMIESTEVPDLRDWPWENVWLGATIVNQEEADRDIPKLLSITCPKRFISMEPLLGPVDLNLSAESEIARLVSVGGSLISGRVDWVIVGGESGPNARPMHPDWARSLRDQCADAGVPFLFKQFGEWAPGETALWPQPHQQKVAEWFCGGWRFESTLPRSGGAMRGNVEPTVRRLGKNRAGRRLDGVTHDGFPGDKR